MMMRVSEANALIGQRVRWRPPNYSTKQDDIRVWVTIRDVRFQGPHTHALIEPVDGAGMGERWVEIHRLDLVKQET